MNPPLGFLDSLILDIITSRESQGSSLRAAKGETRCAFCPTVNNLTGLPCGHSYCPECIESFNDEFETETRCPLCMQKKMDQSQADFMEYRGNNMMKTVRVHELWDKQREAMQVTLKGEPIICAACKERAAQVYKNQETPKAAVEAKDHTCLYEPMIPSLEQFAKVKKVSHTKKTARKKRW